MIGYYNYTVILTYLSLVLSSVGIAQILRGEPHHTLVAVICLLISGICDMFDGAVAATRKRTEEEKLFGIQIDSLCDLVSFGVFPAVMCMDLSRTASGAVSVQGVVAGTFLILASVIRLAFFNVQETTRDRSEKRTYYLGLPVTLVSLFVPFAIVIHCLIEHFAGSFSWAVYMPVFVGVLAILEISRVHIIKPYGWRKVVMIVFGAALFAGIVVFRNLMP